MKKFLGFASAVLVVAALTCLSTNLAYADPATAATGVPSLAIVPAAHKLGALRFWESPDSTGDRWLRYCRFYGRDTTFAGDVLYDSSSTTAWYVTNISPVAAAVDSLGVVDSSTFIVTTRNVVKGVALTTVTNGNYGWICTTGMVPVRFPAPNQKAVAAGATNGYAGRFYRAGMAVCGSNPGVARVASITSGIAAVQTATWQRLWTGPSVFGSVAINGTKDSTLINCYINCK
jgi:hypothetical protein